jgi:DNA replication protein DnaC
MMPKNKPLNMEDAFEQMERLARAREQSPANPSHFQRSDDSAHSREDDGQSSSRDAQPCVCRQTPLGIYLKSKGNRSEFAVCPACDPQPRCEECGGTGQLRRFNLLTLKDEIIAGACGCRTAQKRAELLNKIQLPQRYCSASFETLQLNHLGRNPALIQKLTDCRDRVIGFCENVAGYLSEQEPAPEKIFLTLLGPVGTGKTLMGSAALKWFVEETGCSARFVDFLFLLSQLRESYTQNSSEEKILKPLREADVLLIDELGKGRAEKAWQMEKLDDLINSRYNAGRVTILTTNYLPPEATYDPVRAGFRSAPANESFWEQSLPERIGARMYDRIVESSVFVDFIGLPSFRRFNAEGFLQRHKAETSRES